MPVFHEVFSCLPVELPISKPNSTTMLDDGRCNPPPDLALKI